ncbi:apoptosis regulator BAX-like isoform X1 [Vanacampus margaritifer]
MLIKSTRDSVTDTSECVHDTVLSSFVLILRLWLSLSLAKRNLFATRGDSKEQILELGAVLLKDFIYERVRRHGDNSAVVTRTQLGGGEICDTNHKRLAQCLQKIGDELDGNMELQQMINCPSLRPSKEVFVKVAVEIFSDGKFSWGRVVTLFYLACRLVIKALLTHVPDIIRTIINWTIDYLRENVINWIREQGGWEGIRSYFGTPTWQMVAVFMAGVITTILVARKM